MALIKANQLIYTSGSPSVREKWDSIRENMISLIRESQTEKSNIDSLIVTEQENNSDEHIDINGSVQVITSDYISTSE